jgi:hypothetical protein
MLLLAELDALRSQLPYGEAAARLVIDCALQNADRAVALDARNLREMQAQVVALFYDRQFARMTEIGERASAGLSPPPIRIRGWPCARISQAISPRECP